MMGFWVGQGHLKDKFITNPNKNGFDVPFNDRYYHLDSYLD